MGSGKRVVNCARYSPLSQTVQRIDTKAARCSTGIIY